jgi:hypothetical protein
VAYGGDRKPRAPNQSLYSVHDPDDLNAKWRSVGLVSDDLQMSWIAGMHTGEQQQPTGATSYLEDNWQSYGGRKCLHFRSFDQIKNILVKKIRQYSHSLSLPKHQATHVVVALTYGHDMFIVLRDNPYCAYREHLFPEYDEEIGKEECDVVLNRAADRFVQNLQDMEQNEPFDFLLVNANIYWDPLRNYRNYMLNVTHSNAVAYCHEWLTLTCTKRSPSIPLTVWLCPLEKIGIKPTVAYGQPFNCTSDLVQQCLKIWSYFADVKSKFKKLIPSPPTECTEQQDQIKKFWLLMLQFMQLYRHQITEIIKDLRSRKTSPSATIKSLTEINSIFLDQSILSINPWLESQQIHANIIHYLQKIVPTMPVFYDRKHIDFLSSSKHNTLVLLLPRLHLNNQDLLFEELQLYLKNTSPKKLIRKSPAKQLIQPVKASDRILLRDRVIEFVDFAKENADCYTDFVACFEDDANVNSRLQLLCNNSFTIPRPPDTLAVEKCDDDKKVLLTWKFIPDPLLRGFMIEYRPVNQSDWVRVKMTEKVGRIELKLLKSELNHVFRVASLTVPGKSQFSSTVSLK